MIIFSLLLNRAAPGQKACSGNNLSVHVYKSICFLHLHYATWTFLLYGSYVTTKTFDISYLVYICLLPFLNFVVGSLTNLFVCETSNAVYFKAPSLFTTIQCNICCQSACCCLHLLLSVGMWISPRITTYLLPLKINVICDREMRRWQQFENIYCISLKACLKNLQCTT